MKREKRSISAIDRPYTVNLHGGRTVLFAIGCAWRLCHPSSVRNIQAEAKRKLRAQANPIIENLVRRLKEKVGWDAMQPFYADLYKRYFSEEEVQKMLEFYKSLAGQSLLQKMPQITQETMAATQDAILPILNDTSVEIDKHLAREILRFSKSSKTAEN